MSCAGMHVEEYQVAGNRRRHQLDLMETYQRAADQMAPQQPAPDQAFTQGHAHKDNGNREQTRGTIVTAT
jgi:hypothetical protein